MSNFSCPTSKRQSHHDILENDVERGSWPREDPESNQPTIIDSQGAPSQELADNGMPYADEKLSDDDPKFDVQLSSSDDPKNLPHWRKYLAVIVICSSVTCVACASSNAAFTETALQQAFLITPEISILSVSLYILGLGSGALLLGPLSNFYGRRIVFLVSFGLSFVWCWPVAFAPNIIVFLLFRTLSGFCNAASMSVAGGCMSDLFSDKDVESPMAAYSFSLFVGVVIGPLTTGFIVQNVNWRWTYRVQLIWTFFEFVSIWLCIPETFEGILCKRKAILLRAQTGDSRYYARIERSQIGLLNAIVASCYKPFQILTQDLMAFLLCFWNALVLGILYLAFQVFPIIFEQEHGFDVQQTGLGLLGIGLGMTVAWASTWWWKRFFETQAMLYEDGQAPPEIRMIMGMVGGILVPIALLLISLTSSPTLSPFLPITLSTPFGTGILYIFMSSFTYLVTVYRPHSASVLAANTTMRCLFAAGFPLFSGKMYAAMGVRNATGLLAGITGGMAVLPFMLYKYGDKIRSRSKFAVKM